LVGCIGGGSGDRTTVTREVGAQFAAAKDATIPVGVTLAEQSGPARDHDVVSAAWSFDLSTSWDEYRATAVTTLQRAGFDRLPTPEGSMGFAKHIPGDSYRITIERARAELPTRVTVRFFSSPD
jgi:hypothetical protein